MGIVIFSKQKCLMLTTNWRQQLLRIENSTGKEKITLNTNKKEESQDQTIAGFPFLIKWGTVGETTVFNVAHGCWSFTLWHKKIKKDLTSLDCDKASFCLSFVKQKASKSVSCIENFCCSYESLKGLL